MAQKEQRDLRMYVGRNGDHDAVQLLFFEHDLIIGIVTDVQFLCKSGGQRFDDIAHRDELRVRACRFDVVRMYFAAEVQPYNGQLHLIQFYFPPRTNRSSWRSRTLY